MLFANLVRNLDIAKEYAAYRVNNQNKIINYYESFPTTPLVEINLVNNSDKTKPPTIYVLDNWRFINVVPLGLEPRTP